MFDLSEPSLLYFQLDFDQSQEGLIALVLSAYDSEMHSFTEISRYTQTENQVLVVETLPAGSYGLSVQPI